jgi:hypothetical protein
MLPRLEIAIAVAKDPNKIRNIIDSTEATPRSRGLGGTIPAWDVSCLAL